MPRCRWSRRNLRAFPGQVTLQNADPRILSRLFVSLRSDDLRTANATREVAADGTFQMPVPTPGQYRLWISGVPGVYASQVSSEDSGLHDGVLTIGAGGSLKVNVVASGGMGRLKGFVRRSGAAASGVLVVLAPAALPTDPGWYLGFKTDSDGSFDFKSIRPGTYRLFASSNTQLEYANPAAIRPFLEAAKPLTVEMNGLLNEDLELP
ncbi:MAG: carboxypeptidase-like regulatory domain-containing protein [Paludibaculum sp.]